ncbi:M48 family metallopeptidase ['Paenibacillus yunnanensis' Narsing Rao et al. 2020]|uniref:M48 family metallopeptidase n=1 Tax=Paenibacillus tengchongensis TaxID=2608684 RepID=UPI00124E713E|nr:SprT family zinc-dependent metalloprotease [Paenibacillus tengchongensis]
MQIELDDEMIHIDVQYGKRKKLLLHMDAAGRFTLKAPKGTSEETLRSALERQREWISASLRRSKEARRTPEPKVYSGGEDERFLYLGQEYPLHELIATDQLTAEQLKLQLKRFYFASLKKLIAERIGPFQAQLKAKPKSVEIIESGTKWGSCSADKKLAFNYRLAMAPAEVIDYVIVHELCHLLHMNHDRSFWRLVGSVMPDYEDKEAYLARQGQFMTL